MSAILRWLWSTTMVQTLVNKNLRNLAIAAGSIVAAFAVKHGAQNGDEISQAVTGLVIAGGGWGWSMVDAWVVKRKIATAAATAPTAAPPPSDPVAKADAASPKDKDALIEELERS